MNVQNTWNAAKKVFLTLGLVGIILTNALFSLPAEANSDSLTQPAIEEPILIAYYDPDIVSIAVEAGRFNTLTTALKAAGLVEVLQGEGPFTVFAPTDEAFAALPPGLVEDLLRPENKDDLIKILTYHVVPGKVMSYYLEPGKVKTVEGDDIYVRGSYPDVKVNNANVIIPDIPASNGVIHVIDSVILPPF